MGNGRTIAIYPINCAVPPLLEIFRICARETWHDPSDFHFFLSYCASKCAPRFLYGRAHTGMLCLVDGSL
jgi:hypothetical protein